MTPTRPRRILYVETNEDGTVGGSYLALSLLVAALDRRRFEPVVLFYEDNPHASRLADAGVDVRVWEAERHVERSSEASRPLVAALASAVARRFALLRRERIDLVHLNGSPSLCFDDWLPAARLARIPCITHARAVLPPPRRRIGRWLASRFDRVVAISDSVKDALVRQGLPAHRIRRIHDGIDAEALRAAVARPAQEVRSGLGVPADGLLAVMVGHLRPWKGQAAVLEALAQMDAACRERLRVVFAGGVPRGEETYASSLEGRARELGLEGRVAFLGARDDVADLMNAADFVLHASLVPEPFGLVVVEGLALGKPVLAANRGGPLEILTPDCGVLFDPDRPESLAAALADLCRDPERRRALGAAARERAQAFGSGRNAAAIQDLYRDVLSDRSPAPARVRSRVHA